LLNHPQTHYAKTAQTTPTKRGNNMPKIIVLKPNKEFIILRKANKNHICHDSGKPIYKGEQYIEDHINYLTRKRDGSCYLKWYVNKISLKAWKGPVPT
jgi:hypothetical protein